MPYNTATIPRPTEITGTSVLPLARVKKIIAQDDDIAQCSNSAAFAISVATEEFLRYITEQAFNVAKSESKPRRTIMYKDVAAAVAKFDNLQFLSDVVPRTVKAKDVKKNKTNGSLRFKQTEPDNENDATNKQRSINHMMQNGIETTNGKTTPPRLSMSMADSPILGRDKEGNINGVDDHDDDDEDVEMQD